MAQKGGGLAEIAENFIPTVELAEDMALEEAQVAGEGAEARGG